jgi:hypothetical protein
MTAPRTTRRPSLTLGSLGILGASTVIALAPAATAAPAPRQDDGGHIVAPARTQITVEHTGTGFRAGTANQHESRPALSIVKLYIADYVFAHGTPADQADATRMLQTSDDGIASRLYAKYPQSISTTANAYGLNDTHDPGYWGDSTTSTADSVTYLEAKKRQDPGSPVLAAMASASPVAADGMRQDYGTAVLPGVIGTKWGWSDDRTSFTASASYGADFSVAAQTNGPAAQLTGDVVDAFQPSAPSPSPSPSPSPAPGIPGLPDLQLPDLPDLNLPEMPPMPELPFP